MLSAIPIFPSWAPLSLVPSTGLRGSAVATIIVSLVSESEGWALMVGDLLAVPVASCSRRGTWDWPATEASGKDILRRDVLGRRAGGEEGGEGVM
jgi:hypothetical protein